METGSLANHIMDEDERAKCNKCGQRAKPYRLNPFDLYQPLRAISRNGPILIFSDFEER